MKKIIIYLMITIILVSNIFAYTLSGSYTKVQVANANFNNLQLTLRYNGYFIDDSSVCFKFSVINTLKYDEENQVYNVISKQFNPQCISKSEAKYYINNKEELKTRLVNNAIMNVLSEKNLIKEMQEKEQNNALNFNDITINDINN